VGGAQRVLGVVCLELDEGEDACVGVMASRAQEGAVAGGGVDLVHLLPLVLRWEAVLAGGFAMSRAMG
jgi:hypothetical protein